MHKLNVAIKHITDDLSLRYQFNTTVSGLMELFNNISALPNESKHRYAILSHCFSAFVRMLSPIAPHLAESLWETLRVDARAGTLPSVALQDTDCDTAKDSFCMHAPWPVVDEAWITAEQQVVVVQVNGKVRGRVTVNSDASNDDRKMAALACSEAQSHLADKEIVKVIVPPGGKLVSVVVR
jgi:leucyl-tRNA synthetase